MSLSKDNNKDWCVVYTTAIYTEAEIIRGKLQQNEIPVRILNKQDSMYIVVGEIELYVPFNLKDMAISIINDQ